MNENNSVLEPLSRRESAMPVSVSLRGSLAQRLMELQLNEHRSKARKYIQALLVSTDLDLVRFHDSSGLVIGLRSERGMFYPDW